MLPRRATILSANVTRRVKELWYVITQYYTKREKSNTHTHMSETFLITASEAIFLKGLFNFLATHGTFRVRGPSEPR